MHPEIEKFRLEQDRGRYNARATLCAAVCVTLSSLAVVLVAAGCRRSPIAALAVGCAAGLLCVADLVSAFALGKRIQILGEMIASDRALRSARFIARDSRPFSSEKP